MPDNNDKVVVFFTYKETGLFYRYQVLKKPPVEAIGIIDNFNKAEGAKYVAKIVTDEVVKAAILWKDNNGIRSMGEDLHKFKDDLRIALSNIEDVGRQILDLLKEEENG